MSEWISVEDRLPDRRCQVLAVRDFGMPGGVFVHLLHFTGEDGAMTFCRYNPDIGEFIPVSFVTHWMPVPEPPGAEP